MTRFTQQASDTKVTLSPLDGDMINRTVDAVLAGLLGHSAALSLLWGLRSSQRSIVIWPFSIDISQIDAYQLKNTQPVLFGAFESIKAGGQTVYDSATPDGVDLVCTEVLNEDELFEDPNPIYSLLCCGTFSQLETEYFLGLAAVHPR